MTPDPRVEAVAVALCEIWPNDLTWGEAGDAGRDAWRRDARAVLAAADAADEREIVALRVRVDVLTSALRRSMSAFASIASVECCCDDSSCTTCQAVIARRACFNVLAEGSA